MSEGRFDRLNDANNAGGQEGSIMLWRTPMERLHEDFTLTIKGRVFGVKEVLQLLVGP